MLQALSNVLGANACAPFVRQFYAAPSRFVWHDAGGKAHDIFQAGGSLPWVSTRPSPRCSATSDYTSSCWPTPMIFVLALAPACARPAPRQGPAVERIWARAAWLSRAQVSRGSGVGGRPRPAFRAAGFGCPRRPLRQPRLAGHAAPAHAGQAGPRRCPKRSQTRP